MTGAETTPLPPALRDGLELVVAGATEQPGGIRSIVLRRPDGAELPGFVAGSHLVVDCGAKVNAYSLTGSGLFPTEYTLSVLRDDEGAGGSRRMHDLSVGDTLRTSRPRSAFATVANARHHVLVAAGIGVTPMLSHARALAAWGKSATVLYVHRPDAAAHLDDLRALAALSDSVTVNEFPGRAPFAPALVDLLSGSALGTHLYVCGPGSFMDDVLEAARRHGWPETRLHAEAFGATSLDPGAPFDVLLSQSGERLHVPPGVSLLEALEASGRTIPNMCRQGVCGECVLTATRGRPLHRDHYLSDEERASGRFIMCCVSRSLDEELELSL